MSKAQSYNQRGRTKAISSRCTSLVFDFGVWILNIGLLFIICAVDVFAQDTKCTLKISDLPDAPELFGFRMGMTPAQVKIRVSQVAFQRPNDFGVSKTSLSPDFDPRIDKTSLAGVRTVSLDFLDDRLTSLWFGYDGSFKWQTVPDFVKGVSQSLHLPDAWRAWKVRGQQIDCADFQLTVVMVGEGPSFHIIDETAEQTIAARREAKEEQDAAAEAAQADEIVADAKARLYYLESCQPPTEVKQENRVVFKSREEAEKAGYKLARACQ
jgi:hypothetical protein